MTSDRTLSREELSTTRDEVRRLYTNLDSLEERAGSAGERLAALEERARAHEAADVQRHGEVMRSIGEVKAELAEQRKQAWKVIGVLVTALVTIASAMAGVQTLVGK